MALSPLRSQLSVVVLMMATGLLSPVRVHSAGPPHVRGTGAQGGNLVLSVPLLPKPGRLHPLCRALLTVEAGGPGAARAARELAALEPVANAHGQRASGRTLLLDATGGTVAKAEAWCDHLLRHPPGGKGGHDR